MISGVFFLVRRGENVIFRVVIDHGLGQQLVLRAALYLLQVGVDKGGNLIYVQINIRDIFGFHIIQPGICFQQFI